MRATTRGRGCTSTGPAPRRSPPPSRAATRPASPRRIWAGDHTLWKPGPTEIANRLGWLRSPAAMRRELPRIRGFVEEVRRDGVRQVLLLGMGGSSLAPELFTATFGAAPGHPRVERTRQHRPGRGARRGPALPAASRRSTWCRRSPAARSRRSRSSSTSTRSPPEPSARGAPGRTLRRGHRPRLFARGDRPRTGAREVFLNDPDVGGRFSALTLFGLVPAALDGVDLERLLASAESMAARCGAGPPAAANPGVVLGALAGGLALAGRRQAHPRVLRAHRGLRGLGGAARRREHGQGGEGDPPGRRRAARPGRCATAPTASSSSSLLEGDRSRRRRDRVARRRRPPGARAAHRRPARSRRRVLPLGVRDRGGGAPPRRQPLRPAGRRVREAGDAARALAAYRERGALPRRRGHEVEPGAAAGEIARLLVVGAGRATTSVSRRSSTPRGPARRCGSSAQALRERSGLAVTAGFGPRFLHSTGQLHKGGLPGGIFLQLVSANPDDLTIPDDFGAAAGSIGFRRPQERAVPRRPAGARGGGPPRGCGCASGPRAPASQRRCGRLRGPCAPCLEREETAMEKIYVIDTNVLVHDPEALLRFEDNEIVLPIAVIEELDGLKRGHGRDPDVGPPRAAADRLVPRAGEPLARRAAAPRREPARRDRRGAARARAHRAPTTASS